MAGFPVVHAVSYLHEGSSEVGSSVVPSLHPASCVKYAEAIWPWKLSYGNLSSVHTAAECSVGYPEMHAYTDQNST